MGQPHVAFEAKFGKSAYSWTVCSFDAQKAAAAHSNERPVWRDSHEWQTYKWAKLPKQTHLLQRGLPGCANRMWLLKPNSARAPTRGPCVPLTPKRPPQHIPTNAPT